MSLRYFRRTLRWSLVAFCFLIVAAALRVLFVFRDRYPGYKIDIQRAAPAWTSKLESLRVGFGRVNITPQISDPARPVWLAGFANGRRATRIQDDLWVVALVVDDGATRLGMVAVDSIGIFHDDVISVRRRLPEGLRLDYATVCATHNHSTPDMLGLWGPSEFRSGVDPAYREGVINACVDALTQAVNALEPVQLALHEIESSPAGLVKDTRAPEVYDPDLRVLHFTRPGTSITIGTLVGWANHPETPWSGNSAITADFPGIIRDSLEKGIRYEGQLRQEGLGGIHLFINGAVGGLMTTHPSTVVRDPFLDQEFKQPSHDKTRAVGNTLVQRILQRLKSSKEPATRSAPISIRAKTFELPVANRNFILAGLVGLLDRGHSSWMKMRTEAAILKVGEASIACIPGEIYPEIVNGGIVRIPGGDFEQEPLEIPPIREMMPGRVKFIFGLANDEIGYIIPKSEWDAQSPHPYFGGKSPYGEINSLGPDTAYLLHQVLKELSTETTSSSHFGKAESGRRWVEAPAENFGK